MLGWLGGVSFIAGDCRVRAKAYTWIGARVSRRPRECWTVSHPRYDAAAKSQYEERKMGGVYRCI